MERLSKYDDKWPGQEKAQPIGAPPKGMWYDPEVKESSDTGVSLNDAIKHFISNPQIIGKPSHVDMQLKMVELDNGSAISFDDIVQEYKKVVNNEKTSDFGFFDGPVDLGKDPKGDFPSVQWMPRGTEDEDLEYQDNIAASQKTAEQQLTNKIVTEMIPMFVDATKPDDHKCKTCRFRIESENGSKCSIVEGDIDLEKGTCAFWAEGEKTDKPNPSQMTKETAGYVESDKKINCGSCRHYGDNSCGLWTAKVKPEQCCMAWEDTTDKDAGLGLSKLDKTAYEDFLTQDQKNQIAAAYGPEYNSAVGHYYEAIKNGHPQDKALDYAVAEMKKVGVTISPTVLLEVTNTYLR